MISKQSEISLHSQHPFYSDRFRNTNNSKRQFTFRNISPDKINKYSTNYVKNIPSYFDDSKLNTKINEGKINRDRLYASSTNLNQFNKALNKNFSRKATIPNPILKVNKTSLSSRLPQINKSDTTNLKSINFLEKNRVSSSEAIDRTNPFFEDKILRSNNRRVIFKNQVSVFRFDSDGDSGCSASSEYEKQLKIHSPLLNLKSTCPSSNAPKNTFRNSALSNQNKTNTELFESNNRFINNMQKPLNNVCKYSFNDSGNGHLVMRDEDDVDENESGLSVSPDHANYAFFSYSRNFPDSNLNGNKHNLKTINFNEDNEIVKNSMKNNNLFLSNFLHTSQPSHIPSIVTTVDHSKSQSFPYTDTSNYQNSPFHANKANSVNIMQKSNLSEKTAEQLPAYGYEVSIEIPQKEYEMLKKQKENEILLEQQKKHEELLHPLKQHKYPSLPYSLYLKEVKNHQEATSNLKHLEKPVRQKPQATFKYNPFLGSSNGLLITVCLGSPLQPNDVLVKANKSGSKLRLVSHAEAPMFLQNLNEQILLPIQIDPFKISARIDTSGNLLIEAPIAKI